MEGVDAPRIRYATGPGGIDIAWEEFGRADGPAIVVIPGFISHLELNWNGPPIATLLQGLATVCRVVTFDKRGTGLSSRDLGFGSLAERADDVRSVLDAAGWERAHLFGMSEGGPMAIFLAASYPERVASLSLYGSFAVAGVAPNSPTGPILDADHEAMLDLLPEVWGTGQALRSSGLVAHGEEMPEDLAAHFERNACTPHMIVEIMRRNFEIDVRTLLSAVHIPTLVVHATGDPMVNVANGRYLAANIDGARYVEFPAAMHTSWHAQDYEPVLDAVLEFVAGSRPARHDERVLATVLFTDIVDSTGRAANIGDRRWRVLLDEHDLRTSEVITRFGGHLVKQTGDGALATFDGPARAVQCAQDLRRAMAQVGLPIRAGLHTGEIEHRASDVGGIAVHIAARVAALAGEGEVLVSRTVRDLVVGSDLLFDDRGAYELKGVPDRWELYAAV